MNPLGSEASDVVGNPVQVQFSVQNGGKLVFFKWFRHSVLGHSMVTLLLLNQMPEDRSWGYGADINAVLSNKLWKLPTEIAIIAMKILNHV
jgi:hypothetical protein